MSTINIKKKRDTLPPLFPLELKKDLCDVHSKGVREDIHHKTIPIFSKVLQEHQLNHTMVGFSPSNPSITFLWQPHNHRLYFDFLKENFNPKKPSNHTFQKYKSMVGTLSSVFNQAYTYTSLNYGSEHKYEKFMFCTIRVKKNQVEVINHYHTRQWRRITAESVEEVDQRIDAVMESLKEHSIKALKYFIQLHGGKSNFNILNQRCEHGIHGDDYLDKIPSEMVINDTYIKKLYKEKVEFKATAAIKNYVSNRAVEKIYPEIALEINRLNQKQEIFEKSIDLHNKSTETYNTSINALTEQMQLHLNVMRNINKTMSAIRNELKPLKRHYPNPDKVIDHLFDNPLELARFKAMSKPEQNKILFGE
jgi:hypothetical protein